MNLSFSQGIFQNLLKIANVIPIRNSHPEMFLVKGVLKICSKFTGEHPCRNVISIKLLGCSCPIHKKGDKLNCNNYRPYLFYLILAKFMFAHPLTNFLQVNKLFFSHPFGFRNGYSTNHALTSLTETIRKTLDDLTATV